MISHLVHIMDAAEGALRAINDALLARIIRAGKLHLLCRDLDHLRDTREKFGEGEFYHCITAFCQHYGLK